MSPDNKPLVAIVGPTAVGKSRLALHLAPEFDAEIVSADSRQVYRHFDIGTAKPTREEFARIKADVERQAYPVKETLMTRGGHGNS